MVEQRSHNYLSCQTPQEGEISEQGSLNYKCPRRNRGRFHAGQGRRKEMHEKEGIAETWTFSRLKLTFERILLP